MNQDQKTNSIHDAIKALGALAMALAPFCPAHWQQAMVAIPGFLTSAYGVYLSFQFNATPSTTTTIPHP